MNIEVLQLSNYVRPEVKEMSSKDYVLNGDKNSFYKYIIDRYNGSPTNRAIIDSKAQFIYGKGLMSKQQANKAVQFAAILQILSKKDLRNICKDEATFTQFSIELIYKGGELKKAKHVSKNKVVPNKMNEDGDIPGYWYSQDWDKIQKFPPVFFDAFGFNERPEKFSGSLMYVSESYQVGRTYFADPCYLAGLPYAELEEEIANYSINHIKNGLSAGYIINFNNGVPNDEDKRLILKEIDTKISGSEGAGKKIVAFNDNSENAATIAAVPISDAHQQYEALNKESSQKLMISHRITSPILFGIKDNTGFGNNADEMESAFNELMINVIQPEKEVVLDALMEIFIDAGYSIDLDFIPLREIVQPKKVETTQTNLSKEEIHTDDIIADALINLGEDISDEEWELMESKQQDGTPEVTELALSLVSVALASVPSSFPSAASDQDTTLFKIRYSYEGNANPQREFCSKMMKAGKVYRKEDIELAGSKAVNKGLGPHGADTYNIWLYKGGANCNHYWMRKIYLRRDNTSISSATAREMINALDPSDRQGERIPQNEREVAMLPTDMVNNGYLPTT